MIFDIQKASLWKRISAALFDFIILGIVAIGAATIFSGVFGYEEYLDTYSKKCEYYSEQYGVELSDVDESKMTEAELDNRKAANKAINADKEAVHAYRMVQNLSLLLVTFGVLFGILLLQVAVPAMFGNGQSLGKKMFGIALMRVDGVKLTGVQLFTRSVLGKFTVELMIPIYVVWMLLSGKGGLFGLALLLMLLVAQILCLVKTRTGSLLHDVMSGTVAVDLASQMIFDTKEDQIEYIKKHHAQEANDASY